MEYVGADPRRTGARPVKRIQGVWCYDIRYSRSRLPKERRVRDPWHVLVYCLDDDGAVAILAVVGRSYLQLARRDKQSEIVRCPPRSDRPDSAWLGFERRFGTTDRTRGADRSGAPAGTR